MKPFYKRTEFWLGLLALVLGGLMGSGIIGPGTVWAQVLGQLIAALGAIGYTVATSIAKMGEGLSLSNKPGYRTTEFWQSVAAGLLGLVQLLSLLPAGSWAEQLILAVLSVLPPVAYSVGRGGVKATGIITVFAGIVLLSLSACASVDKGLGTAHDGLVVIGDLTLPVMNRACMAEAQKCNKSGVKDPLLCTGWQTCVLDRRAVATALKSGHGSIKSVSIAVEVARAHGWLEAAGSAGGAR